MRIRPEHAESSHLLDQEGFITQLCQDVAHEESWVKRAWPPAFIRERVRYAYDRATIANGFARDVDINIYVKIFFDISVAFDQHPAIAKVLHNPSLSPDEKWDTVNTPEFSAVWDGMDSDSDLFPESSGRIEEAYPTTWHMPGFQKLYAKIRKEQYPFLADGQSLDDE